MPARTFSDLVSLLPQDKVELDLNERTQTVRVQSGRTDANIKGIDAQEFPIIPTFNTGTASDCLYRSGCAEEDDQPGGVCRGH